MKNEESNAGESRLSLGSLIVLVGSAFGQFNNPQDPANWETLPMIQSGQDELTRAEYQAIIGQPPTVIAHYVRQWSNMIWVRNGVPLPNQDILIPWAKMISEPDTVTGSSVGTETLRLRWKNAPLCPAPAFVRVTVSSHAIAVYWAPGTGDANSGLNDSALVLPDFDRVIHSGAGSEIRTIPVTNGVAEVTLNKSSVATGTFPAGLSYGFVAFANSHGSSLEVDSRNVLVTLNSYQYEKQPTNTTVEYPYNYMTNPHHDEFTTHTPNFAIDINEFEWEVEVRLKEVRVLEVNDIYNTNGYQSRIVASIMGLQQKVQARRLFYFYRVSSGGGSGLPGGGH